MLTIKNLHASVDGKPILKGIDLEVNAGKVHAIMGPNGSGKSTFSRIGEEQLFYCRQRGLSEENAISMIVNGFCNDVFRELSMEFAVEAQKLLGISLEGSVG